MYTFSSFLHREGIYNLSKTRSKKQSKEATVAIEEREPREVLEGEVLPVDPIVVGGEESDGDSLPEVVDLSDEADGEVI